MSRMLDQMWGANIAVPGACIILLTAMLSAPAAAQVLPMPVTPPSGPGPGSDIPPPSLPGVPGSISLEEVEGESPVAINGADVGSPQKQPEGPYPEIPGLVPGGPEAVFPGSGAAGPGSGAPDYALPTDPSAAIPFAGGEVAGAAPLTGGAIGASEAFIPMFGDISPMQGAALEFRGGLGARPIGDLGVGRARQEGGGIAPPPTPIQSQGARITTRARVFKIADNQVTRPVDRVFFTFNHFEDVNDAINRRLNSNVYNIQVQRYVIGLEKTFWDRQASLGIRLPLNVVHGDSFTSDPAEFDLTRTSTALGDLFVYSKFVLYDDSANNFLVSGGLALTLPVGPTTFAGAKYIQNPHSFAMQPYLSFYKSYGRLFLIAFEAIDVPLNEGDATLLFNDFAVGYVAYRNEAPDALIRLVAPVFEAHVNVPLSHRDPFDLFDLAGTPDVVNLTYGLNVQLGKRAILSGGMVTPVTGPRPFDFEAMALLNIYY